MSQFFASDGQSIGVSASASVLPMNIQHQFPLGLTGLISLQSRGHQELKPKHTSHQHSVGSGLAENRAFTISLKAVCNNYPRSRNSGNSERLYLGGFKITADGNCSHEIKRHLLLGRKAMTNPGSIFKSRDIILPTKVHLVKAMVFPVVMYGCESWTIKKAEH